MIKYLWGKNPHWNDNIFESIDWKALETCMKKMARNSGSLVTNELKLVHGWQNDGQQKELFYEDSEETFCSAGCGNTESRMHFIQCTARNLQAGYIKRREEFKRVHCKLKTARVIFEVFMIICISLRCGDAQPSRVTHFDSDLDKVVQKAWEEQWEIGWDHIIKDRLSKYWGIAQGMFTTIALRLKVRCIILAHSGRQRQFAVCWISA